MQYKVQIYIDGTRIELFEDENISLNQSIQNLKDISKVFTDFTQSFTIPASNVNNAIFEHWYNADITSGFNAKVRKDATIELNYMPFKQGKMQLDGVKMKNGKPYNYKITFFGLLLNLTDLFGDDELSDLSLSTYDHDYTSSNVKLGVSTGLSFVGSETFGSIIYPMISSVRDWQWDAQATSQAALDIQWFTGTTVGISYDELKPALKINRIIEAIESDYGITFDGEFFGVENNHVDNLYLWLNKEKGSINPYSDETTIFTDILHQEGFWNPFYLNVTPGAGYEDVKYKIIVEGTNCGNIKEYEVTGTTTNLFLWPQCQYNLYNYQGLYDIRIAAQKEFTFSASWQIPIQSTSGTTGNITITNGNATISANMPDMKLTDFVGGLVKMFNLVIEPVTSTKFNIKPLDEWYLDGQVRDVSSYIDITEFEVNKPNLWRRIDYLYEENDTVLNKNFRETNKRDYGNLEAEFVYDGGVLEVKIPFTNLIHTKLSSVNDNTFSDMHVGKVIEVNPNDGTDVSSVDIPPLLFYNKGHTNLSTGFSFINDDDSISEVKRYHNVGQEDKLDNDDITESLNFGNENSTWTLTTPPVNPDSDSGLRYSLYSNFWEDYITDAYDNKRRQYSFSVVLPLGVIRNLKMNDVLKIRDRIYTIQTITTNLTTGKGELELLNYIGAILPEELEAPLGFDYNLDFYIN